LAISKSQQFLLSAKKMNTVGSDHYNITLDYADTTRTSPSYLGKLRSSKAKNEFNLFSTGENPTRGSSSEAIRNQLGAVYYVSWRRELIGGK